MATPNLTAQEELALRQLCSQSISIAPAAALLLVKRALAMPYRGGWRCTPLGLQVYEGLRKAPLQGRKCLPVIDRILDRAIPRARAVGIFQLEKELATRDDDAP